MPLVALAVAACASVPKATHNRELLTFLADGSTSCDDVLMRLGDPSRAYENGRLMTFRIAGDAASGYAVTSGSDWSSANYSLVVQCDAGGRVASHSLVAVKREP